MADGAFWRCVSYFSGPWQCNLLGSQWDSHKPPGFCEPCTGFVWGFKNLRPQWISSVLTFWVSQLGSQLWFMKREQFPFKVASIICRQNRDICSCVFFKLYSWKSETLQILIFALLPQTHLIIFQSHEIIVNVLVSCILLHPCLKFPMIQNFSTVL